MPIIKLLVEGGSMSPGPALSQQLGPMGINIGQVISKVNESTKDFNGLKVPVALDVDSATKEFTIQVFSPPVSELLKKELKLEKGSGEQAKMQVANASIEQLISIAKTKQPDLLAKDLKAAVLSVAGTCTSLGVLVENNMAPEACQKIRSGKYDEEIKEERAQETPEKRKELDNYFAQLHTKQEQMKKEEEEAAAAEEAAKAEAAAQPAEGEEGAVPVAGEEATAQPAEGEEGAEEAPPKPEEAA
jgi:large subunit ribosomal protein L11